MFTWCRTFNYHCYTIDDKINGLAALDISPIIENNGEIIEDNRRDEREQWPGDNGGLLRTMGYRGRY